MSREYYPFILSVILLSSIFYHVSFSTKYGQNNVKELLKFSHFNFFTNTCALGQRHLLSDGRDRINQGHRRRKV